jgi:hypothetical protein
VTSEHRDEAERNLPDSTFAWSPTSTLPSIATGTVAGALDESFSNESQLEIWQPDFMNKDDIYLGASPDSKPIGYVTDTSRYFHFLPAVSHASYRSFTGSTVSHGGQVHKDRLHGVIAAGTENGELAQWDPAKIMSHAEFVLLCASSFVIDHLLVFSSASESLILRNTIHSGPIRGFDFNPIQTNLLSSGAVSGEVRTKLFGKYTSSQRVPGLHKYGILVIHQNLIPLLRAIAARNSMRSPPSLGISKSNTCSLVRAVRDIRSCGIFVENVRL